MTPKPVREAQRIKLRDALFLNARNMLVFGTGFELENLEKRVMEHAKAMPQPRRNLYLKAWAAAYAALKHNRFLRSPIHPRSRP